MSGHRPHRGLALALALACALTARVAPAAPPPDPPNAAAVAEAKKLFERGLKLYKEKAFREALALFVRANEMSPRASIQKNVAQCYRDLQEFASAYDAYTDLLDKYAATLSAAETATIKNVVAELALLTGAIRVTIAEPGATVRIDGRDVGTTPLAKPIRVKLERHQIVIAKVGFETLTKDVDIAAGATVSIDGPLETEVKTGRVVVTVKGAGDARVLVDGEDVGAGPSWEGDVSPGSHTIEARGASVSAPPVRVEVARRARVPVSLELRARVGRVQVDAHAADAEIAVDGRVVGRGAWEGDLPVGRHELTIALKGFETHKRALIVSETQTVEDVHLKAAGGAGAPVAPTYVGIYSNLDFFGVASPGDATNGLAQSCPTQPCQASSPLGAGLGVRVGYSFGWLGVEGLALGMYDTSDGSATFGDTASGPNIGIARTESYRFHRYGGGGALGARVTSKHPNVRFTFGAALGIEYKGMVYKRDATATGAAQKDKNGASLSSSFTSSATTYTAPMIVLDLGILLGSATSAKFHIGALAILEMVGDPVFASGDTNRTLGNGTPSPPLGTPPLQLVSGTQFFIGPVIGLHFGE